MSLIFSKIVLRCYFYCIVLYRTTCEKFEKVKSSFLSFLRYESKRALLISSFPLYICAFVTVPVSREICLHLIGLSFSFSMCASGNSCLL